METPAEVRQFGRKAVDELDARLLWLQAEWSDANAKRTAWMLILGEGEAAPTVASTTPEQQETVNEPASQDMSETARKIIGGTGEAGFWPKQITAELKKLKFEVGSGFASNLLFRMKKRGEVVEHNGKYFLPKFDPKPRLNMEN